jgi:competence protein ComEA
MGTGTGTNGTATDTGAARTLAAGDVVRDLVRRDEALRAAAGGDADASDIESVGRAGDDDDRDAGEAGRDGGPDETVRRDAVVLSVVVAIGLVVLGVTLWRGLRTDTIAADASPSAQSSVSSVPAVRTDDAAGPLDASGAPGVATAGVVLRVHVAGAVQRPGVYRLSDGSRAEDAVAAAGGALPGAFLDAVNLAAPLRDGEQLVVPATAADTAATVGVTGDGTATSGPERPVDLNRASAVELETLPGVGPSTAKRIIEHRERRPFASVRDLLDVPGIGEVRFAQLRDRVTV